MSPEAGKMIIKFNCHSSFRVDGKHYLLKFISWQAQIPFFSPNWDSDPCVGHV